MCGKKFSREIPREIPFPEGLSITSSLFSTYLNKKPLLKMDNVMQLVDLALQWVGEEITQSAQRAMRKWLEDNLEEWKAIARDVINRGVQWGIAQMEPLKDKLIQLYHNNDGGGAKCAGKVVCKTLVLTMAETSAKQAVQAATKSVVQTSAKQAVHVATKTVARKSGAIVVKQATKKAVTTAGKQAAKQATKQAVSTAGKQVATQTLKGAIAMGANPMGIAADLAQAGFEMTGHKEVGKAVGATGNMASGAMAGFLTGGPPGAVLGALAGLTYWGVGEALFYKWS